MEEHKVRVFENRVLKRMFGRKAKEVRRDRRKLHIEELHKLYCALFFIFFCHWLYSPLGPWPLLLSFMIILL
jgi:hypothetical protein